ncbi:MAG TPA: hypothetical protein ENN65_03135 [Candidatus Hydrogenedentes bacterium]|nr:hypothetical protein [Candidatus Hydrogenedentota bacterium]
MNEVRETPECVGTCFACLPECPVHEARGQASEEQTSGAHTDGRAMTDAENSHHHEAAASSRR